MIMMGSDTDRACADVRSSSGLHGRRTLSVQLIGLHSLVQAWAERTDSKHTMTIDIAPKDTYIYAMTTGFAQPQSQCLAPTPAP